jgi:hypothetical protein
LMGILGGAVWIVLYTRNFEKITDSTRVSR